MISSEIHSGRSMNVLGVVILVLSLTFLYVHKIGFEAALWSAAAGILLIILGSRKLTRQRKKMQTARSLYPYWK